MKEMLKKTNINKSIIETTNAMDKMSREAKRALSDYKKKVVIVANIQETLHSVKLENNLNIQDFWIPVLDEENDTIVKINGLKEDDFDAMDAVESFLNKNIHSKYIHTIMVA